MLTIIDSPNHPLFPLIQHDPVRPEVPPLRRIQSDCTVFALVKDQEPASILCCRYTNSVPDGLPQLFAQGESVDTAVFYSIWSLVPGTARTLIESARSWILEQKPSIIHFITLSPPTEMARLFHLRNGATVYRINSETVNYRYESRKT